ncbi:MAG: metal-dependent transcriptional regulator [Oscillospiraceae bacterium]
MNLYESGENYLETILILSQDSQAVKSVDVAARLGFSKASVSRAMHLLYQAGYIEENYRHGIVLTKSGTEKAVSVLSRHHIITDYLMKVLGVDFETADKDACRIEHIISEETFMKMSHALKSMG